MELIQEKKRELVIITNLSSEEITKRLSQNMVKPIKWYAHLWPFETDRPYAGEIIGKKFKMSSLTEPITIHGEIEEIKSGVAIKMKINPQPIISPNFGNGTMVSFVAGMGGLFIVVLGGVIYFVDLKPIWFLAAAILLCLIIGLIIWQYNKHYQQQLQDRINRNIVFITKLLKD